jgi:hypothetical protein
VDWTTFDFWEPASALDWATGETPERGDVLTDVPFLAVEPETRAPFDLTEGAGEPMMALPAFPGTGLVIARLPAIVWIAPLLPSVVFAEDVFERLLAAAERGAETGYLPMPPLPDSADMLLAAVAKPTAHPNSLLASFSSGRLVTMRWDPLHTYLEPQLQSLLRL